MTFEESQKLKQAQLYIMDSIHDICERNGISYYIAYGTLLGAVRHKGFIPWDIDMDIVMFRKDYVLFKEACLRELDNELLYYDYETMKNYDRPHALVSIKDSKLCSGGDDQYKDRCSTGIFVDVFPIDNIPNDNTERKKHKKSVQRIRTLRYLRLPYYLSPMGIKRLGRKIIKALLIWIPIYNLNSITDRVFQAYNNQDSEYVASLGGAYSYEKETLRRDIFKQTIKLQFEDRIYNAPGGYHEYLTNIYGDYRKLPPKEMRQDYLKIYDSIDFGAYDNR